MSTQTKAVEGQTRRGGTERPVADETAVTRATALLECQKAVLERIGAGKNLSKTLELLTLALEANASRKTIATIMLVSDDRSYLYPIAGNSAPLEWREYVARVAIGPNIGSCGSAAFTSDRVIVADIATDSRWVVFKDVALRLGLKACWSTPIISADKSVLGTFAIYYPEPTTPTADEIDMVEMMTRSAAVAIQNANLFHALERELTTHRQAEINSRRLAAIVEGSDDAIIAKDLNGIVQSWNRGAQRIFGYTAEEMIGKSITTLITEDRLHEEPEILAQLRAGKRIDHFETVRKGKDGKLLNVSVTVSPIRDASGEIIGASKIARDITELKRQQEALKRSEEELSRHNQRLEEQVAQRTSELRDTIQELEAFSYSVSHDMRSPLRAMQGYSDALLKDYKGSLDETAANYLTRIHRASHRMDLLIQDVLAYSRVAKGDVQLAPVNVEGVIADVIHNYPALQPDRAKITVLQPLPVVIGNEAYLTQVISNLLGNAVKFVDKGKFPDVTISAQPDGDVVRINFRDNGIGIEPEQQKHIFQIFGRVYSEKKFEGTGIGLAIVKKAAERMGGSVGVVSEFGHGSEFYVLLRRA